MDKKVLIALVEEIVTAVAAKHGLEEVEARTLVGICLRKNKDTIVAAVVNPMLTPTAPATAS